jgi:hypothetical protein
MAMVLRVIAVLRWQLSSHPFGTEGRAARLTSEQKRKFSSFRAVHWLCIPADVIAAVQLLAGRLVPAVHRHSRVSEVHASLFLQ